jgi:PAS domain S-box-containing protein
MGKSVHESVSMPWVDRWVPPGLSDPGSLDLLRARVLILLSVVLLTLCVWSASFQLLRGSRPIALVPLAMIPAVAAMPALLRRTGSLRLAGNVLTSIFFLGLTAVNVLSGARAVAGLLSMVLIPPIAALVAGRRAAVLWTALACAELALLPALRGIPLPFALEPEPAAAATAMFRAPLVVGLGILLAILVYESVAERALRSGEESRARLEESLELQRRTLEELRLRGAVIDQATDGVAIVDRGGTILYCNEAYGRMTGHDPRQLVGKSSASLAWTEAGKRRLAEAEDAVLTRGASWTERYETPTLDGSHAHLEVRAFPVRDEQGEVSHVVALFRDVSREVELEKRALQSQKMEAIGRLAGGVAHDFNNLLTAILGHAQYLGESVGADPELREDVKAITEAAERSAALTRQLLAFSRHQVLELGPVDLNRTVSEVHDMLRRLVPAHIELRTRLDPTLPTARADRRQIEQVILNLVLNARDAGSQTIVIATDVGSEGDEERVVLSVEDDGSGMAPETRARAFEPFFTTKGPGEGTGLGLATVHGIVHQSGGRLELTSALGGGTLVRVLLPIVRRDVEPEVPAASELAGPSQATATVLLVEDDALVRGLALRTLEGAGHRVLVAASGEEALALARRHEEPIDLLVSDLVMPGMGGVELADRLEQQRPGLRVLFVSGYASDEHAAGTALWGRAFLSKPFTRERLLTAIDRALAVS